MSVHLTSHTPRTPGGTKKPGSKLNLCYAYSRGQCLGAKANPPCTRQHVALTEEQKRVRDKWEEAVLKAGKQLPYKRSDRQAAAAGTNAAPGPGSDKGGKGGKAGKGANSGQRCWWTDNKPNEDCPFGATCRYRKNTPNHRP